MAGMGTKVHCKSYFPGYCSMRDLNEDADSGSWPIYHEDRRLMVGQYYNDFLPRPPTDGYSEYDKEVLRQTMLKHEATFKTQASQSMYHSSSSQRPSEHAFKMWDISGKPSCSKPSFSGTENRQSPSELVKSSSMQDHSITNGSFRDCRLLDSNSEKLPRRMFDLQLPADQYIDNEEGESNEGEKVHTLDNNVNWSLGSGRTLKCQDTSLKSDLPFRNKQSFTDLNHPIQGEEAASSASVSNFLGPVACRIDIQVQDTLQKKSGSLGHPREIFRNTPRGMNNGTHSNILHLDMAGRQEGPSYNLENGGRRKLNHSPQGFVAEESPTTSKPIQGELRNTQLSPFHMEDQNKRGSWRESGNCATEFSNGSEILVNQNYSRSPLETGRPITYPTVPDVAESGLSSFSSWKKPASSMSQSSIAVQAVHSSNTSAQLSKTSDMSNRKNGICEAQWHINGYPRANSSLANGISFPNGFLQRSQLEPNASEDCLSSVGFDYLSCSRDNASPSVHFENHSTTKYYKGSECMDVKSAKDLNLNIAIPNVFMEGTVLQQDILDIDGGKNHDPVGGLPWLKRKPACSNGSGKGMEALNDKGSCLSHQFIPKVGSEKVLTPHSVQDSSSTSIACDAEDQRIQKSDSPRGKRILGVSIFDKTHISKEFPSLSFSPQLLHNISEVEAIPNGRKPETINIDLTFDPVLPALGQKLSSKNVSVVELDKGLSSVKHNFNLNSCADEEEPCTYSLRRETIRIEIDLEALPVPEASEVMSPEEKSHLDQLEISAQSSQVKLQDQSEELARNVAEAIVTFSSSCFNYHSEGLARQPSKTSLDDSLRWFADVVSSQTEGVGGANEVIMREKDSGEDDELSSNSSDYFETMTLKLTETKEDDYFSKPWEPEPLNEEEACVSALVPTRRRRGQARRGRQRRDFQRDILPGLASLSRHEVSEDIQVIGGLMRATGHSWQTGVAKRNAARNGWARGRRRTRNVAPAVAATIVCSPPRQQANNSELGLEERSLTGWGKTTRRPRRQRLAAGNISIPITQV
ncbi:putative T-box transcription factor [Thalictrum thalictroides]|uniref:Putative T-box transcription factor n=1 Tax=Thalictrum thalictroides TaxID=46969 RepID=A0A7J6X3A5_THATH|nr:putative T-box transcription factor [Thalictrum thalictroides]